MYQKNLKENRDVSVLNDRIINIKSKLEIIIINEIFESIQERTWYVK